MRPEIINPELNLNEKVNFLHQAGQVLTDFRDQYWSKMGVINSGENYSRLVATWAIYHPPIERIKNRAELISLPPQIDIKQEVVSIFFDGKTDWKVYLLKSRYSLGDDQDQQIILPDGQIAYRPHVWRQLAYLVTNEQGGEYLLDERRVANYDEALITLTKQLGEWGQNPLEINPYQDKVKHLKSVRRALEEKETEISCKNYPLEELL